MDTNLSSPNSATRDAHVCGKKLYYMSYYHYRKSITLFISVANLLLNDHPWIHFRVLHLFHGVRMYTGSMLNFMYIHRNTVSLSADNPHGKWKKINCIIVDDTGYYWIIMVLIKSPGPNCDKTLQLFWIKNLRQNEHKSNVSNIEVYLFSYPTTTKENLVKELLWKEDVPLFWKKMSRP